ncbi:hypothetical protein ISCGN_015223 [Ixodes scapularis]|uniref:Uncharacterized protein n=1 Tax=Ixodes scapularis TaxID=6945 RepID=B7PZF1_IXOSC|nr:conserved hypothetical protein [Ixodes scapularis]|eukprot:XP_002405210.1 conserved hypothetical protein [Ixodes scapularis]
MGLPDKILKTLEAYGDSLLDDENKTDTSLPSTDFKRLKRASSKAKKAPKAQPQQQPSKLTELQRMKLELGLDDVDDEAPVEEKKPRSPEQKVPVIVFNDPTKRKVRKVPRFGSQDEDSESPQPVELNFRKAKFDVIKFGIKGLEKPKQVEAKIALAVQLGAKPPKNKYVNYKQLIQERKQQKDIIKEQKEVNAKTGVKPKKQVASKQSKEKNPEKHDGVHYVSKKLISKVQKKGNRRR